MARRDSKATAAILVLHRYLAVAVGIVMTVWCLSGFVMMYQAYPELTEGERLTGLSPLDLSDCCDLGTLASDPAAPLPSLRIEMLGRDPVLRLSGGRRQGSDAIGAAIAVLDLGTGEPVAPLASADVAAIAAQYAVGHGLDRSGLEIAEHDIDQWTVQTASRNRPAYHVAFHDTAATEIYVSGATGEVFQDTNRRERILTWLGAIPHWLYPLELRRNAALWTEIVIWSAVIGTFLTGTGLWLGISRHLRARARGRWSPFRGWWYWHHIAGLVFGVLTLTWVFSGLLTMTPWGLLTGGGANPARTLARSPAWSEMQQFLSAAATRLPAGEFVQLRTAPFDGDLYVLAIRADGTSVRLDRFARPAGLERATVESAIASLPIEIASFELLTREDNYYYGHPEPAELPVYRVTLDDPGRTLLYVDHVTGAVRVVDGTRRISRWIRTGLHDMDFPLLRLRPVWDIAVIVLLAGVTLVCFTGTWMALKRIRLDWRRVRRKWRARQRDALTGDGRPDVVT